MPSANPPTLLCLVAHPDDETRLCGGTLALLARRGVAVHVACLTRGEGGEVGEPPRCTQAELGAVRAQEMNCAVTQLGAQSLTFLGYVDPVVGPGEALFAPAHEPATLAGQIADLIRRLQPEAVLTHGSNGEYGHPAHVLVHQMTRAAVTQFGAAAPALYTFAANFPEHPYPRLANAADPADLVLDVTEVLEAVAAATLCHATQCALFVRRRSQAAGRPVPIREIIFPQESVRVVYAAGGDVLRRWLS